MLFDDDVSKIFLIQELFILPLQTMVNQNEELNEEENSAALPKLPWMYKLLSFFFFLLRERDTAPQMLQMLQLLQMLKMLQKESK